MRAYEHTWTRPTKHHPWHSLVHHRFHALTWVFGPIHQTKVLIEYPHTRHEHEVAGTPFRSVGIKLPPGKSRAEAMRIMLDWIKRFREEGVPGPEESIAWSFEHYPDLYDTRAEVIDHLFFSGGTGIDWLDGALMDTDQEPVPTYNPMREQLDQMKRIEQDLRKIQEEFNIGIPLPEPEPPKPTERPLPDDGAPLKLVGFSDWSNIRNVPPDVRPDWLKLAIEAATLLRDRAADSRAADIGRALVPQLEQRLQIR